jgi:PadR family transcriptional regulator AphA
MNTPNERKSQERTLTTTSYAVLAVLALRDHSTYELTKQMRYSMHYMWPRAESNMYAEPKRLVAAGLVTSREEWTGERRRTVYAITDEGRAALSRWLAAPIRAVRDDSLAVIEHFQRVADRYDAGEGEYPHRFALSALVARLLGEQHAAAARWAAWAEQIVSEWDAPSGADAAWGIETLRDTGRGVPVNDDPVRAVVRRPAARPR